MRSNNKYYITKNVYPGYLVLFKTNKSKFGYRTYEVDRRLLFYLKEYDCTIYNLVNVLETKHINYLLIDRLTIIRISNYEDNQYHYFLYKALVTDIINRIRARI